MGWGEGEGVGAWTAYVNVLLREAVVTGVAALVHDLCDADGCALVAENGQTEETARRVARLPVHLLVEALVLQTHRQRRLRVV